MKFFSFGLIVLISQCLVAQNLLGNKFIDYSGTHSLDDEGNTIVVTNLFPQDSLSIEVYDFANNQWLQRPGHPDFGGFNPKPKLSGDGNTLIIGKPSLGVPEIVSVFQWDGNTWAQKGNDFVLNSANTLFGNFVFINDNGNRIFFSDEQGDLLIYQFDGTTWNLISTINDIRFQSVDINSSGDRISYFVDNFSQGSIADYNVKVFEFQNDVWQQVGNDISTPLQVFNSNLFLKTKLNSAGDTIVISAPSSFQFNTSAGALAVYRLINDQWIQLGNTLTGDEAFQSFGSDAAINASGDRVLVGITSSNVFGQSSGNNKLFELNTSSNEWDEILEINGELAGIQSGVDVDMNSAGDVISIGTQGVLKQVRVIGVNNLSTSTATKNDIEIYPNPTTGILTITLEKNSSFDLFSSQGQLIYSKELTIGKNILDLENIQSGLYFAQLFDNENAQTFKILIK